MQSIIPGSAILAGLILFVSGTGKLPGQTEFIDALLQSFWTPAVAYIIGYCLPWLETGLGLLLFLGIFPRVIAAICLPFILGFAANNIWALVNGIEQYPQCGYCFGIWEDFFGALSPLGALGIDILLFGISLSILLFYKEGFFTFRPWFFRRKERQAL